jgi:hypothetical protein
MLARSEVSRVPQLVRSAFVTGCKDRGELLTDCAIWLAVLCVSNRRLVLAERARCCTVSMSFLGEIIRCRCVITMIIGSLSSAGAFTRKRCPSGAGMWEKILLSTTLIHAQRQMADFGAGGQQPIWARNGRELFLSRRQCVGRGRH